MTKSCMVKKENTYQSISCSYYDQLEAYATQRTRCSIVFTLNDAEQTTNGTIVDLFARDGAEYLKLDNGTVIRLDHIVSVNGIALNYAC
jgi:Rho-binding antiterminator